MSTQTMNNPHAAGELLHAGASLDVATGAVILLHGRGGSAADILSLASPLERPGIAYLAPEAAGRTWYPQSFLAPREQNEPYISSALDRVEQVIRSLESGGMTRAQIVVCGFSQGACLSSEFAASHPARYAGVIAFTGGLVGPLGSDLAHAGSLEGTPVLLSSGDPDPHVPWVRVQQTADELSRMGAQITARRYPGRSHSISSEEIRDARMLLEQAFR
jgi:phospholipase/carboxylesterase